MTGTEKRKPPQVPRLPRAPFLAPSRETSEPPRSSTRLIFQLWDREEIEPRSEVQSEVSFLASAVPFIVRFHCRCVIASKLLKLCSIADAPAELGRRTGQKLQNHICLRRDRKRALDSKRHRRQESKSRIVRRFTQHAHDPMPKSSALVQAPPD